MDGATVVALASAVVAAVVAVTVPWMTFRYALRQDEARWLREQRAGLYVDVLAEVQAEQLWVAYVMADDTTREKMQPTFTDLRLPPVEVARLGSRAAIFASKIVNELFGRFVWEVSQAPL